MKRAVGLLVILIIIGVAGYFVVLPLVQYGESVTVADVTFTLNTSGGISTSAIAYTAEVYIAQGPINAETSLEIDVREMASYEYQTVDREKVSEQGITASDVVDLVIEIYLETPTGTQVKVSEFNLDGHGFRTIEQIIGPDEGITETGTFKLLITFSITVTPPSPVAPTTHFEKTIEQEFTIPASEG